MNVTEWIEFERAGQRRRQRRHSRVAGLALLAIAFGTTASACDGKDSGDTAGATTASTDAGATTTGDGDVTTTAGDEAATTTTGDDAATTTAGEDGPPAGCGANDNETDCLEEFECGWVDLHTLTISDRACTFEPAQGECVDSIAGGTDCGEDDAPRCDGVNIFPFVEANAEGGYTVGRKFSLCGGGEPSLSGYGCEAPIDDPEREAVCACMCGADYPED